MGNIFNDCHATAFAALVCEGPPLRERGRGRLRLKQQWGAGARAAVNVGGKGSAAARRLAVHPGHKPKRG